MVTLLWFERAIDGTAAGAHLQGTRARFATLGIEPYVIADQRATDGSESLFVKSLRLMGITAQGISRARRGGTLFARSHPLTFLVAIWWRLIGGTVVLSIQGSLDDLSANEVLPKKLIQFFRWTSICGWNLADSLVVGAPVLKEHVLRHTRSSVVHELPNGVFLDALADAGETARPLAEPYVVYVGNLAPWQGIEVMLEASSSPSWPGGVPLVIVGDGALRDNVTQTTSRNVVWVGRKPSVEARQWLKHATCSLSLKRSDTDTGRNGYWPFKLIESAAVGTPIVSSDAIGMATSAEELGHAIVVPSQDAEAAAKAVAKIVSNPDLRKDLSDRGLVTVKRYDWRANAEKLGEVLREAQRG